MANNIEEFLRRLIGERNKISGEVIPRPRNVLTGKIADRPASTISLEEMAEMDKVAGGVEPVNVTPTNIAFGTTPGRGLEPRFTPGGRQRSTTELLAGGRVPEVLPDTGEAPGPRFDWAKFIETAGMLGAALAPQGAFAKAGLTAAGLVGEERERGVKAATAAEGRERFDIETRLKEVDDRLAQAKHDYNIKQDAESLEKLLTIEREKSRLRIEEEKAKQPAKEAKAKKIEDKAAKVRDQQVKNRIRSAKNSAIKAIRQHELKQEGVSELEDMDSAQIRRIREIIQEMDVTGDETTNELIRRAVDLFIEEGGAINVATDQVKDILRIQRGEVSAEELLGPDEESTDFITDEELLRR